MVPPLSWISTMWAFFWRRLSNFCWVWQMMRMAWQYFFIWAKSFSISFLPKSSFHFKQDLVNAFFLDWDLFQEGVSPNPKLTQRGGGKGEKEKRLDMWRTLVASSRSLRQSRMAKSTERKIWTSFVTWPKQTRTKVHQIVRGSRPRETG